MTRRHPWFRVYHEARCDSKLMALTDAEFRTWFNLLCYSCEKEPRGQVPWDDPEFVAIEIRTDIDELTSAVARMERLRLIETVGESIAFPSFERRQYDSPSSAPERVRERVREHRGKASGNES